MRNDGLGLVARTPGPQDPAPHRPGPRGSRRLRAAARPHHPPRPRSARARRRARRPRRLPRPQPPRLPGDAVRGGPAGRGLRPPQHPPRRPGDRLPARPTPAPGPRLRPARSQRAGRRTAGACGRRPDRTSRSASGVRAGARPQASAETDRRTVAPDDDLHDHVHLGDHRAPQGRDAHPRQPDLERDQHPGRQRPDRRRGDAGVRPAVPHGRPQHAHPAGPSQGRHLRPGRVPSTPTRTLDLVERHRVTFMFGVPTMYRPDRPSLRAGRTADLSSVRILTCGGAPGVEPAHRCVRGARPDLPPGLRHDRGVARHVCSWTPSTP